MSDLNIFRDAMGRSERARECMALLGITAPDSLRQLLSIARQDTGGGRRIAGVLLSLWDGDKFRCDLQGALYVDSEAFAAVLELLAFLAASGKQLGSLLDEGAMRPVIRLWGDSFRVES